MKTSELIGTALDWAVAKCLDGAVSINDERGSWLVVFQPTTRGATGGGSPIPPEFFSPSTDWAIGGKLIEREKISVWSRDDEWAAESFVPNQQGLECVGPTPLIAAMRCYVASVLGDEVEPPKEISNDN